MQCTALPLISNPTGCLVIGLWMRFAPAQDPAPAPAHVFVFMLFVPCIFMYRMRVALDHAPSLHTYIYIYIPRRAILRTTPSSGTWEWTSTH